MIVVPARWQRTTELRETLRATGDRGDAPAVRWFYDPPWTLPYRRRNETAITLPPNRDGPA